MTVKVIVKPGPLIWSGEHWINYIRERGAQSNSGMVSLFHTRYCAAGEGNVAFVAIPEPDSIEAVCTDNPELARFIVETFARGRRGPFDRELPLRVGQFTRGGDIRVAPYWSIDLGDRKVVATWSQLQPPVLAAGTFREATEHFTVLFFAEQAAIQLDEQPCPGSPYRVETWRPSIGEERSSCVFALAETLMQLPTSP